MRTTLRKAKDRQGGFLLVEILCAIVVIALIALPMVRLSRLMQERDIATRRTAKTQRYLRSYEEMARYVPYELLVGSLDGSGNMVFDNGFLYEPYNFVTRTFVQQYPYKVKVMWTTTAAGTADEYIDFVICVCVTDPNVNGTGQSVTTHELSQPIRRYPSTQY